MNPPRAGSIPVVRPSINGPFVTEKPKKNFFCKSSRGFQTHPSNWYGIRLIKTIDSRRLLAESTNRIADHSLYEVFKTSLIGLTLLSS